MQWLLLEETLLLQAVLQGVERKVPPPLALCPRHPHHRQGSFTQITFHIRSLPGTAPPLPLYRPQTLENRQRALMGMGSGMAGRAREWGNG